MILPTLQIEEKLWASGYHYIVGLDEVGRGSFAGSVVVGAVIIPKYGLSRIHRKSFNLQKFL